MKKPRNSTRVIITIRISLNRKINAFVEKQTASYLTLTPHFLPSRHKLIEQVSIERSRNLSVLEPERDFADRESDRSIEAVHSHNVFRNSHIRSPIEKT